MRKLCGLFQGREKIQSIMTTKKILKFIVRLTPLKTLSTTTAYTSTPTNLQCALKKLGLMATILITHQGIKAALHNKYV